MTTNRGHAVSKESEMSENEQSGTEGDKRVQYLNDLRVVAEEIATAHGVELHGVAAEPGGQAMVMFATAGGVLFCGAMVELAGQVSSTGRYDMARAAEQLGPA